MSKAQPSLILEIQQLALSEKVEVAALLRKAKAAAVKLGQAEAVNWIDLEHDGYNCAFDDLPSYRKTHGILKVRSPYYGLIPVHIPDQEVEDLVTRAPTTMGVGTVQTLVDAGSAGRPLTYNMGNAQRSAIFELLDQEVEPVLLISYSQLRTILESVISLVLNWSLELEKAGILGEGLSFSKEEKEMAKPITQTIIAQNIGHLGDLSGSATGRVDVKSTGHFQLDQRKIDGLVSQAKDALPLLPQSVRTDFEEKLGRIETAVTDEEKRSALQSAQNVLEGAGGNLAAQGILALIASIFG